MKIIKEGRLPIKMWLEDIEAGALQQAKNLANLPFAYRHIAIMPDCHQGYGMPIGGVMATRGVVIPNAVGVDIGCGMCAIKTDLTAERLPQGTLKDVLRYIRSFIPVGFKHHQERQDSEFILPGEFGEIIHQEEGKIDYQIGTLGGGNHFIEIQKDQDDFVWIMIHSGSRNLGYKVAAYYNKKAIALNNKWFSMVPKEHELAFLPLDGNYGEVYLNDMQICVDFAFANRKLMMDRIKEIFLVFYQGIQFEPMINIAHNYAAMENHRGQNVMVHRKGATRARLGEIGIIPGSQGTSSFIVEGLGNPESFISCSHGAGRKMGRKQAIRELSLEDEQAKLDKQGIIHSVRGEKSLDEAPGAYKDIAEVMANQVDLVKIVTELKPIAVIKG